MLCSSPYTIPHKKLGVYCPTISACISVLFSNFVVVSKLQFPAIKFCQTWLKVCKLARRILSASSLKSTQQVLLISQTNDCKENEPNEENPSLNNQRFRIFQKKHFNLDAANSVVKQPL